jgi:TonB family protein
MHQPAKIPFALKLLALFALSAFSNSPLRCMPLQETITVTPRQEPTSPGSILEILTPTEGVDFHPYVDKFISKVKNKWYASMPSAALQGEKGATTIRFGIHKDGGVYGISIEQSSGNDLLDQAAIKAIDDGSLQDPLPSAFKGTYILLRFKFFYNVRPPTTALTSSLSATPLDCNDELNQTPSAPPFDRLELLAFVSHAFDWAYANREICRRGIDFNPDSPFLETLRIYGVSPDLALAIGKMKPQTVATPSPDRARAYNSLTLALSDVREAQPAVADVDYKRALQFTDNSAALHLAYAAYLLIQKKNPEAESHARQSLAIWSEDAEAHLLLAFILSVENNDNKAVPEAREALRIAPRHKAALAELGFSLTRSGQYADAIPVLRDALPRVPELPLIRKCLGGCLVHTRDFDAAIKELTAFLAITSNDAEAHYFLGVALRETGKKDEAQTQFREATRIEPSNPLYAAMADTSAPVDAPASAPSSAAPKPEDGFQSDNIYTNTYFGFSYEFPRGWVVMDPERCRGIARFGGSILANGDPVLNDAVEVGARNAHPLLCLGKQTPKDIASGVNLIQIQAFDKRLIPDQNSGESFDKSLAVLLQHRFQSVSVIGSPSQFVVAGRTFWRLNVNIAVANEISHAAEIVKSEKDYILLFVFTTPDASKLEGLVATIQSLRFIDSPH